MNNPRFYRIRFVPDEIIDISGDELVFMNSTLWVTKWVPIKPRNDFAKGLSYTFLNEGYKISRFMDENEQLLYWYCDIINVVHEKQTNTYRVYDLLVDVKIMPDGKIIILDLDELAEALENGVIDNKIVTNALVNLDKLLKRINSLGVERLIENEAGNRF